MLRLTPAEMILIAAVLFSLMVGAVVRHYRHGASSSEVVNTSLNRR